MDLKSLQAALTVCERTFVLGKILNSNGYSTTNVLEVMGLTFIHEMEERFAYDLSGFRQNLLAENCRHTLLAENWEVVMLMRRRLHHPLPIEKLLKWGAESYHLCIDHKFSGDQEAFENAMLYAKMIGDDYTSWNEATESYALEGI